MKELILKSIEPIKQRPSKVFYDGEFIGEIDTQEQLGELRLTICKNSIKGVCVEYVNDAGEVINIDIWTDGSLNCWPKGFMDITSKQLYDLVSCYHAAQGRNA